MESQEAALGNLQAWSSLVEALGNIQGAPCLQVIDVYSASPTRDRPN